MRESPEAAPNFADFIDEEILRTDIPFDEPLRPTDGSVIIQRNGVRMQVRRVEGEQRIEI